MMKRLKNNKIILSSALTKKANSLSRILCTALFCLLAVCQVSVAEDYLPDSEKLVTKAAQSKDLYVEPDFNFQTFNTYTLELFVNDSNGQPLQGVLLRIFSTDAENVGSEESLAAQKSLLGIVKTDHHGSVYQTIEISGSIKQVLLQLNSQSPNNQVLIKLADQEYISHVFEVD
jgi:hypothetical protein